MSGISCQFSPPGARTRHQEIVERVRAGIGFADFNARVVVQIESAISPTSLIRVMGSEAMAALLSRMSPLV